MIYVHVSEAVSLMHRNDDTIFVCKLRIKVHFDINSLYTVHTSQVLVLSNFTIFFRSSTMYVYPMLHVYIGICILADIPLEDNYVSSRQVLHNGILTDDQSFRKNDNPCNGMFYCYCLCLGEVFVLLYFTY